MDAIQLPSGLLVYLDPKPVYEWTIYLDGEEFSGEAEGKLNATRQAQATAIAIDMKKKEQAEVRMVELAQAEGNIIDFPKVRPNVDPPPATTIG